jgi:hypothetical protein
LTSGIIIVAPVLHSGQSPRTDTPIRSVDRAGRGDVSCTSPTPASASPPIGVEVRPRLLPWIYLKGLMILKVQRGQGWMPMRGQPPHRITQWSRPSAGRRQFTDEEPAALHGNSMNCKHFAGPRSQDDDRFTASRLQSSRGPESTTRAARDRIRSPIRLVRGLAAGCSGYHCVQKMIDI